MLEAGIIAMCTVGVQCAGIIKSQFSDLPSESVHQAEIPHHSACSE
jgi:hypothetical protein